MQTTLSCDDGDVCTDDSCDSLRGCQYRSWTLDQDGDGHQSARPGYSPGAPGACGDDCDDLSALAFPGNEERCDGVDNDCDGIVDPGVVYVVSAEAPVRISSPLDQRAMRGGFAGLSDGFALTYGSIRSQASSLLKTVDVRGAGRSESRVTQINTASFPGSLVWSGRELGTAWVDDRVDDNYEIYFARFSDRGEKLANELRLTDATGYSLNPSVAWNRAEYLVVWDDRRDEAARIGDLSGIYAQRITADGSPLGKNVLLTPDDRVAEAPSVAFSPQHVGVVFTSVEATVRFGFRVFDAALSAVGEARGLTGENVQSPSVHWVGDRFVVFWETYTNGPGDAVWGATFDEYGVALDMPRRLTSGARFARTHAALSLGDRMLLTWADDHDGNYELYAQVLSPSLQQLAGRQRLTFDPADTLYPALALGPTGEIGVLFDDWRSGSHQVYFTTLQCPPTAMD